jgi:hypothetical protein
MTPVPERMHGDHADHERSDERDAREAASHGIVRSARRSPLKVVRALALRGPRSGACTGCSPEEAITLGIARLRTIPQRGI